jgi:two-component system response regulator
MSVPKILLVEDNPSDIGLTQRALARSRIANELVVAEDGEEALDYLLGRGSHSGRDLRDAPALILLDLKLPKVSGLEVLRELKSSDDTKGLPVVVLTTSAEAADLKTSYALGANSYIVKPVDFGQFTRAVEQVGLYWLVLNLPPPPAH